MTPIIALFAASLRAALPLRRTALFGLLALTPALLFVLSAENRTGEAAFRTLIEAGVGSLFALVLPIIAIVLASGALGNERRDQTLSFIVLRPMPRWAIAVTKIAASVCATTVISLVSVVSLSAIYGIQHGFDGEVLIGFAVGAVLATVAYTAIIVPLGFITDRAVVIGLAYLLVFENGVVQLLTGLASLSPWRVGVAAVGGLVPGAQPILTEVVGNLTMSTGGSLGTAAIYLAIGATLTTLLLKRRQLA